MSPRELELRVADVLAAVAEIRTILQTLDGDVFSELEFAEVRYHLIVIGEAVHHLPESLRRDPTWRPFLELRNHLAHEYFRLNHARIAELIGEPLAKLERASRDLLRET